MSGTATYGKLPELETSLTVNDQSFDIGNNIAAIGCELRQKAMC